MSLMDNKSENNIIKMDSLDIPIYRIFSFKRFEELITQKQLVLVKPSMWDDPYENFILKTEVDYSNGEIASLEDLNRTWYGQCWTENIDTDAMWRIYSHRKDGVRVKTTARKLFSAVYDDTDKYANLKYFIGKVEYKDKSEIINIMNSITFSEMILGGQNNIFAEFLCIKRTEFNHENEVRILVDDIHDKKGLNGLYKIDIEPNDLFDEICLDPRLSNANVTTLTSHIKSIGVNAKIIQSDLYKFNVPRIRID
ncbi:Protein of uncharacterised function (DUF2971) [Klebsiella pneumoniae]|uniref:DUF2971 domain-containing protein n=2 Tax=Klebsiella pneumoniae TaxID=573 RepID=UPI000C7E6A08|nr:DUF2971 domain-containing protein [Klebsiella pneumoniae]VED93695.1 Protein of uncharacterised function (DUF2971) [Klebsiella pneumoniae]HCI6059315.1 DUF2971 domain-containing protein [Klebsiella pneumoniae]